MKSLFILLVLSISTSHAQVLFLTGSNTTPRPSATPGQVTRGYIVVNAEPAVGGAKLIVETFQDRLDSRVNLTLQTLVNSGPMGHMQTYLVQLKKLGEAHDAKTYYQRNEFFVDYKELQELFEKEAPSATGLKIQPGLSMFVKADFPSGHNWGGYDRGGIFFLPTPFDSNGRLMTELNRPSDQQKLEVSTNRPTELDLAYPIVPEMRNIYNDRVTGEGLKLNGQIRSRVEGEGKFQMTAEGLAHAKALLYKLSQNPTDVSQLFGAEWTFKLEDRYMLRDANKNLILGADGMPVPDPMVDTYYDNKDYQAASNDMAIRYRKTEGNGAGMWNFKPGIGRTDVNGVMYRLEYGVDTTDEKPTSLATFADSFHPLNPFQVIRNIIPGSVPSEFLFPAVKIEDHRYKFKLSHASGLVIEISVDEVKAHDLRGKKPTAAYGQIEMDIDHLAVASNRAVAARSGSVNYDYHGQRFYNLNNTPEAVVARQTLLKSFDEKAFFDGRPMMHNSSDLSPESPLLTLKKNDFDLATLAIVKLRDFAIGPKWNPGAQKYAYGAALLRVVKAADMSPSVKKVAPLLRFDRYQNRFPVGTCSMIFSQPPTR